MSKTEQEAAVERFAEMMKSALDEKDWRGEQIYTLLGDLKLSERILRDKLRAVDEELDYDAIASAAADVAVRACAIADVALFLKR